MVKVSDVVVLVSSGPADKGFAIPDDACPDAVWAPAEEGGGGRTRSVAYAKVMMS